jgi:hypothetical protein
MWGMACGREHRKGAVAVISHNGESSAAVVPAGARWVGHRSYSECMRTRESR